jgi:hypothetical protein
LFATDIACGRGMGTLGWLDVDGLSAVLRCGAGRGCSAAVPPVLAMPSRASAARHRFMRETVPGGRDPAGHGKDGGHSGRAVTGDPSPCPSPFSAGSSCSMRVPISLVTGGGLGRLWRRLGSSRAGKDITMRMHARVHRTAQISPSKRCPRWPRRSFFVLNLREFLILLVLSMHRDKSCIVASCNPTVLSYLIETALFLAPRTKSRDGFFSLLLF